MTAASTIAAAIAAGITIKAAGARLVLSASERPDEYLLEALRQEKSAIVTYLRDLAAWTEEDWQALFDERAGIMEYDGCLPRDEAETAAACEVSLKRSLVRSQR